MTVVLLLPGGQITSVLQLWRAKPDVCQTSGAMRGEIAKACPPVIASAAKQSTYPLAAPSIASLTLAMTLKERIRATRWLAMTVSGALKIESQPSSPAKAGDPVFHRR
jgi:hypothetical protein